MPRKNRWIPFPIRFRNRWKSPLRPLQNHREDPGNLALSPARFETSPPVGDLPTTGFPAVPTPQGKASPPTRPPPTLQEKHLSRSWKPANDFASWFFTHRLGLEKPPEDAPNRDVPSDLNLEVLQPLIQPGWLTRHDAAFLAQRPAKWNDAGHIFGSPMHGIDPVAWVDFLSQDWSLPGV